MKKILAVLLTVMMVGTALVVSVGATRGLVYNVPYGTPKVDAELDDIWEAAEWTNVDLPYADDKDTYGHSARVKLMWDNLNLYFYAEVTEPNTTDWNDTFEIYVDELGDKTASYESDDAQDGFWISGLRENYGTNSRTLFIEEVATTNTDTSFTVEAALPWVILEPQGGEKCGLEFMLNIAQADGTFVQALRWNVDTANGDAAPWAGTADFGDMILQPKDAPAAETEPETEAETEPETEPETVAETEPETEPETTAPETEPETVDTPATTAPQTFDIGIIAAVAAALSAAGYAVSRKRK